MSKTGEAGRGDGDTLSSPDSVSSDGVLGRVALVISVVKRGNV